MKGGKARIQELENTSILVTEKLVFQVAFLLQTHYVLNSPVKYQTGKGKQKLEFKIRIKHRLLFSDNQIKIEKDQNMYTFFFYYIVILCIVTVYSILLYSIIHYTVYYLCLIS